MPDTDTSPDDIVTAPEPAPSDNKTRAADSKSLPADPEAPYGYMTDPATGERRPKKRPGRQKVNSTAPAPGPPRKGDIRQAKSHDKKQPSDYAAMTADLLGGAWTILPPVAGLAFVPDDMAIKLRAQATILKASIPQLSGGSATLAEHNDVYAAGLEKAAGAQGPAWIIPCCMAFIPFVAASAQMWRSKPEDVKQLSDQAEAEWSTMMQGALAAAHVHKPEDAPCEVCGWGINGSNAA